MLLAASALKLLLGLAGPVADASVLLSFVDAVATVALVGSLAYLVWRWAVRVRRRLLWRVRRKLIISYLFIGFVPVVLIGLFFTLVMFLMLLSVGSYLVRLSFVDLIRETEALADTTLSDVGGAGAIDAIAGEARRRFAAVIDRYPAASLAILPLGATEPVSGLSDRLQMGAWSHQPPPDALPSWVSTAFSGLVAQEATEPMPLVFRTIRLLRVGDGVYAVIIDLPLGDDVVDRIRAATGITLSTATIAPLTAGVLGSATAADQRSGLSAEAASDTPATAQTWVVFFDYTDWNRGQTETASAGIEIQFPAFFGHILGVQARIGDWSVGAVFLLTLAVIGGLFLIIEVVALFMGFVLARSITGAVHELFEGTERVRGGDFQHRIDVPASDQLGELAASFNSMTRSVEDLLQQAAEKRRLEEELRIARAMQMSLLPSGPLSAPGLDVTAVCIPAREVGGDYYDFIKLSDHRVAVLVADVSGKGTSAAFYMAELKGLMLALSQTYSSPKRLLVEANRILARSLDSRSFVTMTYAVIDEERRTLTYARAGHTPLIYLPAIGAGAREVQVFAPSGLVLGLHLEGVDSRFEELLEESTLSLSNGDLLVLFTDGITEAMNEEDDLFGEVRLGRLLETHAHLPSAELRERVLEDLAAFVGAAEQHDDMTMVVLKIGDADAAVAAAVGRTPVAVSGLLS